MTCKDCLLCPMCFAVREVGEKDRYAENCPNFKNKADFVEVVRCKDCKHAKVAMHRGEEMPDIFKCTYLKPNTTLFDIDFCRYGKRRDT